MQYRIYINNLYDIYGELLSDKQKTYFEEYYFNNLSLGEISENYKVSRNAVYKNLKDTEEKLKKYEEILKIDDKKNKLKEKLKKYDQKTKEEILEIIE